MTEVAIPSNQVGNFHRRTVLDRQDRYLGVAIPSNQVGNFHRGAGSGGSLSGVLCRNPFKSGR